MAIKILASILALGVVATQGAIIPDDDGDLLITAVHTFLTEPEMFAEAFGLTRDKRHAQGAWDFDSSFGGVTLQIKYKDAANKWKGGHAHFEVQDLQAITAIGWLSWLVQFDWPPNGLFSGESRHIDLHITFDGGASKIGGIFDLKIEYTLQHAFEEKGIFHVKPTHVDNNWIIKITNNETGGGNGQRVFPEMESKITLHETRDAATHKIDGMLTVELGPKKYTFKITGSRKIAAEREMDIKLVGDIEGQILELTFAVKHIEWIKFSGLVRIIYGQDIKEILWSVDRTSGTKVIIKRNTGKGGDTIQEEIKYSRTANWDVIKFQISTDEIAFLGPFLRWDVIKFQILGWDVIKFQISTNGTDEIAFQIKREITSTWNRKTTLFYRGRLVELWRRLSYLKYGGDSGNITLQVEEVDAQTKRFSVTADRISSTNETIKEVLKYVNTITHNVAQHARHPEFTGTIKANLDVKDGSLIQTLLCLPSIHCFNHSETDISYSLNLNLDKPWHMLFLAKVDTDGIEVFGVDMQTQTSPYKLTFNWPRMRAIVAPYRYKPLEITANHNPGNSLVVTSNIQGLAIFSVVKMPNGQRKVSLNNKELIFVDIQKSGRTITQSTALPDGRVVLNATFKWGNDNNWLNNNIELNLNGTEGKLDSRFEWSFGAAAGSWRLDAIDYNNKWGDYHINSTGKYANNGGIYTLDVDRTALWNGNNVTTDVFLKLDSSKVGNGILDAITAKLIKVVDGQKYEINVTDGKMALGDFVKVGAFFMDLAH